LINGSRNPPGLVETTIASRPNAASDALRKKALRNVRNNFDAARNQSEIGSG
jgi:hypothetical protein